jgi:hypothetical protein
VSHRGVEELGGVIMKKTLYKWALLALLCVCSSARAEFVTELVKEFTWGSGEGQLGTNAWTRFEPEYQDVIKKNLDPDEYFIDYKDPTAWKVNEQWVGCFDHLNRRFVLVSVKENKIYTVSIPTEIENQESDRCSNWEMSNSKIGFMAGNKLYYTEIAQGNWKILNFSLSFSERNSFYAIVDNQCVFKNVFYVNEPWLQYSSYDYNGGLLVKWKEKQKRVVKFGNCEVVNLNEKKVEVYLPIAKKWQSVVLKDYLGIPIVDRDMVGYWYFRGLLSSGLQKYIWKKEAELIHLSEVPNSCDDNQRGFTFLFSDDGSIYRVCEVYSKAGGVKVFRSRLK